MPNDTSNYLIDTLMAQAGRAAQRVEEQFSTPINELTRLREETKVELPEEPRPAANPYANLGTALGMAATGRGAEYANQMANILQAEKRRMDQHKAQVLNALNYEKLREQNYDFQMANLMRQRAMAAQGARDKVYDRAINAGKSERDFKLRERNAATMERNSRRGQRDDVPASLAERLDARLMPIRQDKNFVGTVASIEDKIAQIRAGVPVQAEGKNGEAVEQRVQLHEMPAEERMQWLHNTKLKVQSEVDTLVRSFPMEPDIEQLFRDQYLAPFEAAIETEKALDAGDGGGDTGPPEPTDDRGIIEDLRKQATETAYENARPVTSVEVGKDSAALMDNPILRGLLTGEGPEYLKDMVSEDINDSTPETLTVGTRSALDGAATVQDLQKGLDAGGVSYIDKGEGAQLFKGAAGALVGSLFDDLDRSVLIQQRRPGSYIKSLRMKLLSRMGMEDSQLKLKQKEDLNKMIESRWKDYHTVLKRSADPRTSI